MTGSPASEGFISWARGHSQTAADHAWQATVLAFADLLRDLGVDADVDLYHTDDLDVDWGLFGPTGIQRSRFVLLAVSHSYRDRWMAEAPTGSGAGAAREAIVLRRQFERDQASFRQRTKIVFLPGSVEDDLPLDLGHLVRFHVPRLDQDAVRPLVRHLSGDPSFPKPPLGPRVRFGPEPRDSQSAVEPATSEVFGPEIETEIRTAEAARSSLISRLRAVPDDGSDSLALPWVRARESLQSQLSALDARLALLYSRRKMGPFRCFRCKSLMTGEEWNKGICGRCGFVNELD